MTDVPGGSGGATARDSRMIEKALRQRWPIPDNLRAAVPGVLARIIADQDASPRNKIAAARALLTADSLNMEQEKRDRGGEDVNINLTMLTPDERDKRIAELLERAAKRASEASQPGGTEGT